MILDLIWRDWRDWRINGHLEVRIYHLRSRSLVTEIPKNPQPGKDDATSADYQCEVEIPELDRSSIGSLERRHVIAEFLDYFRNRNRRKIPRVALTTGVASAPGVPSGDEVEESGATISYSRLFRANETEGRSRLHGLLAGGWGLGSVCNGGFFKGPKKLNI